MNIRTPTELGQIMRASREAAGMTQQALAQALHASRNWVSDVEGGKPTSEIGRILGAMAFLGIGLSVHPPGQPTARPPSAANDTDFPDLDLVRAAYRAPP
jgi:transcriptional regulator with XRE-family HTH domain